MRYTLFDIHSHLNFPQFDSDREEVVAHLKKNGIGTITVGTGEKTSREAVALASQHDHLFATVGIHPSAVAERARPTDVGKLFDEKVFTELATHPKVVAIGECGLDYFRLDGAADTIKQEQLKLFEQHIALAHGRSLPLMIHARPSKGSMDAYEDIISVFKTGATPVPGSYAGNVHFFAGTVAVARKFLDLGFSISFDGPITFATEYDEVVRFVPDDMIMAETDAPFAAPDPFRGKRCDPTMVRYVADRIADVRGEDRVVMHRRLVENAVQRFALTEVR